MIKQAILKMHVSPCKDINARNYILILKHDTLMVLFSVDTDLGNWRYNYKPWPILSKAKKAKKKCDRCGKGHGKPGKDTDLERYKDPR